MQPQLQDGFVSLLKGANYSVDPNILPDTQYSRGLNVTSRGGIVSTRPAFSKVYDMSSSGSWQGCAVYRLNGADRLVFVVSGVIKSMMLSTGTVSVHATFATTDFDTAYLRQVDKYFVVQNGVDEPIIIDMDIASPNVVDQSGLDEQFRFRRGTIMAYGRGRAYVAVDRVWDTVLGVWVEDIGIRQFVFGDLIKANAISDVIKFEQDTIINEGGAIMLQNELGFIGGMEFLRNASTGTGIGSLIVFGRDGCSGYDVGLIYDGTTVTDNTVGQVLFTGTGTGTKSPMSVIAVNNDIAYRGTDGLRTMSYTGTALTGNTGSLSCLPMSTEIQYALDMDKDDDLKHVSATFVDNRMMFTTGGREDGSFRCLGVMDMASVSALGQGSGAMWDGIWTGLNFMSVAKGYINGKEVPLIVHDNDGAYELYTLANDTVTTDTSRLYTKGYTFTLADVAGIFDAKEFLGIELWIKNVIGDVSITAYYKADGYELWNKCTTVEIKADSTGLSQNRYRVLLTPDKTACNLSNERLVTTGTSFQFCLQWTGTMKIIEARFGADPNSSEISYCHGTETVTKLEPTDDQVLLDDFNV